MASGDGAEHDNYSSPSSPTPTPAVEDGPFLLRTLLEQVPLSADGTNNGQIKINCVDFYDGNLYIGTSASELLHFVQIPSDPASPASRASFILASRPRPPYAALPDVVPLPGVQQILLLSRAGKACVLCNWTVTFYSLPELSPVFATQVKNCTWIGGVDLNEQAEDGGGGGQPADAGGGAGAGQTILLSLSKRIRAVRIGDDARVLKTTDFAGCILSVRREAIACVADSRSYALLDIERQQKIPLMTVSSLDVSSSPGEIGHAQPIASSSGDGMSRSASTTHSRAPSGITVPPDHNRSASLSGLASNVVARRRDQRVSGDGDGGDDPTFQSTSPPPPPKSPRPPPKDDAPPRSATATPTPNDAGPRPPPVLKPHIVSPTPDEFLLVTGTGLRDPGIGMFVNLEGDPTRPTLNFASYPFALAIDVGGAGDVSAGGARDEDGYVLASLEGDTGKGGGARYGLEIQRWNAAGEHPTKWWLAAGEEAAKIDGGPYGIRSAVGIETTRLQEVADKLCRRKFFPFGGTLGASTVSLRNVDSRTALSIQRLSGEQELFERDFDSQDEESVPEGWETTRNAEELEFAHRLASTTTRLVVWRGDRIWWAVRNPLLLQQETVLDRCVSEADAGEASPKPGAIDRRAVLRRLAAIRGRDAQTELDFMTFNYLRQRIGILLFADFLHAHYSSSSSTSPTSSSSSPSASPPPFTAAERKALEDVIIESELDPRVVLALVPGLRNEIIVGRRGIWLFGGVRATAKRFIEADKLNDKSSSSSSSSSPQPLGKLGADVLAFMRRFLGAWRRKKGFGSVDDKNVFRTVDAALLLVLIELDRASLPGLSGRPGSVRHELYELVDKGVDCFDRAVSLLETHRRPYVLSRLYQSRKMAGDVLATWRRIVEGAHDDGGGEFRDGERRVREYLSKCGSQALVQEYGVWLANRNPRLGVQVFTDDAGRAPRFAAARVVALLREDAPDAVKYYLEHLVFGKGQLLYVNDLIAYYLGVVVGDIEGSAESRDAYRVSYEAYRALRAPKPTFHLFLEANAHPDSEPWQCRLRLLQLLGAAHDYDAAAILARIAAVADELLVPEIIVLAGREGRHEDALRLLVHRLGDYDTAVAYCVRGGSTIYGAVVPRLRGPAAPAAGRAPAAAAGTATAAAAAAMDDAARRRLFRALLGEFLAIEDEENRVAQTGALLERFGQWFDVVEVLARVPDGWPVEALAGFVVGALRRLVTERRETEMVRALRAAEHVRVSYDLVMRLDEAGGSVETG